MKTVCIILAFLFNLSLQSASASSVYTDKIYPTVIVGGGPAGLSLAYANLLHEDPFMIFTIDVGGPIMYGETPTIWKGRESWKYQSRRKIMAERLGCSTVENESEFKQQVLCFVNAMIKAIGPEHIKSHYKLEEVKTSYDPKAPIELLFRVAGTRQLETVYAQNVDFAIPPEALKKVKFTKVK